MSATDKISALARQVAIDQIAQDIAVNQKIGGLELLSTTEKGSLVGAINEVAKNSGADLSDYYTKPEVDSTFLKTSGGTMTGQIRSTLSPVNDELPYQHSLGGRNIAFGVGGSRQNRGVFDKEHGRWIMYANGAGDVELGTQGTAHNRLIAGATGSLTWQGKNVVRSVGGASAGADGNVAVDSALSTTSTNLVQNKVVTEAIQAKQDAGTAIRKNDLLYDLNCFATRRTYSSKLDNTLYRANTRFNVTVEGQSAGNAWQLFNMNWEDYVSLNMGGVMKITITAPSTMWNMNMDYPFGWLVLSFYYTNAPQDLSKVRLRFHRRAWGSNEAAWVDLGACFSASPDCRRKNCVLVSRELTGTYGIDALEITIDNTEGLGGVGEKPDWVDMVRLSQIEFFCDRTRIGSLPVLTKMGGDAIEGNLTLNNNGVFISNGARNNADSGVYAAKGGVDSLAGGKLSLHGKTATLAGGFQLDANNGTTKVALVGKPDGSLKWGTESVSESTNIAAGVYDAVTAFMTAHSIT